MNGVHDMGGMHGFGPIEPEANEPVFHRHWEGRAFAMTLALNPWSRALQWPSFRWVLESLPPDEYLRMSYYERWQALNEHNLLGSDLVIPEELESGRADPSRPRPELPTNPAPGVIVDTREPRSARFHSGDPVRARNLHPRGHTRLPRYVRGRRGTIELDHGAFRMQDTDEAGQPLGGEPQHVYAVRFAARELWGEAAAEGDGIYLDLWEDYLEPG